MPEEEIRHVIYDCNEIVPLYQSYGSKLIYIDKNSFLHSGIYPDQTLPKDCLADPKQGIAMVVCNKDTGELIKNGMVIVLYEKIFYLAAGLDKSGLSFFVTDEKGRIKIVR